MMEDHARQTGPIHILLVDDEQGFADVLAKRLERRGVKVTKAFSGTQAIQVLRHSDYDAAVLDLKLEDMDGIEILKIFKKMDPAMPVIMLTGHGSAQASVEGLQQGACDYLTKPHDLSALIAHIQAAVGARREKDGRDQNASGG
jgi:DNA-binding response OmpR family regulator